MTNDENEAWIRARTHAECLHSETGTLALSHDGPRGCAVPTRRLDELTLRRR